MNDLVDIFPARVRGLQAIYPEAHQALCNWAAWSRDRAGIFPAQIVPPPTWNEATSGLPEGYAEEETRADDGLQAKAERAEQEPYNELQGAALDQRINSGMLCPEVARSLVIAYVWTIPEYQFPARAGCLPDHFCERLETGLKFASRFV